MQDFGTINVIFILRQYHGRHVVEKDFCASPFKLFQAIIASPVKANNLICCVSQMTVFYLKCNTGLILVKVWIKLWLVPRDAALHTWFK